MRRITAPAASRLPRAAPITAPAASLFAVRGVDGIKGQISFPSPHFQVDHRGDNTADMPEDRFTCLLCGKSYGRMYDMKRHQNMAHSDEMSQRSRSESESEESEPESRGNDTKGSDAEMSSDDLEDNDVYRGWYDQALEASQQSRTEKFEKYLNDDMPEDRAREKAHAKTLWAIKNDFFDSFGTFLEQILLLKEDDTYQDIVSDIEEKVKGGMDVRKAVKRVLPKHKHKFESLFELDADAMEDDDAESEGHDSVDTEIPSRVPGY